MKGAQTGRVAVVTGAGSGAGRAIATALAGKGFKVAAIGRTLEKLLATASQTPAGSELIHPYVADVGSPIAVASLVPRIIDELGPIDVLVNNAGINIRQRSMERLSIEDWQEVLRINLTGPFLMMRHVLPCMRERRSGIVINISSVAAKRASPLGGAAYCASKFGLDGLTGTASLEEAEHGIRCTTISPGEINTPILDARPEPVSAERRAADLQPEDIAAAVAFVIDLPQRAHVHEITIKPAWQPYA